MNKTKIEWTSATWNPIRGCSRVSEGCRNCYAELMAARFSGPGLPYEGVAKMVHGEPHWTGTETDVLPASGEKSRAGGSAANRTDGTDRRKRWMSKCTGGGWKIWSLRIQQVAGLKRCHF